MENSLGIFQRGYFSPPARNKGKIFPGSLLGEHGVVPGVKAHESMGFSLRLGPQEFLIFWLGHTQTPTFCLLPFKGYLQCLLLYVSCSLLWVSVFACHYRLWGRSLLWYFDSLKDPRKAVDFQLFSFFLFVRNEMATFKLFSYKCWNQKSINFIIYVKGQIFGFLDPLLLYIHVLVR